MTSPLHGSYLMLSQKMPPKGTSRGNDRLSFTGKRITRDARPDHDHGTGCGDRQDGKCVPRVARSRRGWEEKTPRKDPKERRPTRERSNRLPITTAPRRRSPSGWPGLLNGSPGRSPGADTHRTRTADGSPGPTADDATRSPRPADRITGHPTPKRAPPGRKPTSDATGPNRLTDRLQRRRRR